MYSERDYALTSARQDELAQRAFIARTYGWMTIGLLVTALTALFLASNHSIMATLFGAGRGALLVLALIQLGVAIALRWLLDRIDPITATAMFIAYAFITGIFFSFYFLFFSLESLAATFFVTAGTFGAMSVYGFVTRRDLTCLSSFLFMGLFGLIIASIINLFVASDMLYWVSTYAGVLVFTLFTAYDTQKMKYMYLAGPEGSAAHHKAAIMAAFELYLDFVILFQYLLRLLGRARD